MDTSSGARNLCGKEARKLLAENQKQASLFRCCFFSFSFPAGCHFHIVFFWYDLEMKWTDELKAVKIWSARRPTSLELPEKSQKKCGGGGA